VREKATLVVRGNHDNSVGSGENPRCSERFRPMAHETGSFTQAVLSQEQKRYLRNLSLTTTLAADGARVLMCHAVPVDPLFQYRTEDSPLWLADPIAAGVNVELVGHTHVPFQRFSPPRRIVNPGSVGQPKHGRAEACYAIWEDGKITLGSAPYDFQETISKLRRLGVTAETERAAMRRYARKWMKNERCCYPSTARVRTTSEENSYRRSDNC
jgi:predicted phosphodiesterase